MSGPADRTRARPSRRVRFREWRRDRPFAGGVLLVLAGLLVGYVPLQFAFELLLVGGGYTFVGVAWAVALVLTGAFALYRPEFSTMLGAVGVALSILSLFGALGGFLAGMVLGIVGGNLCIAWRPDEGGAHAAEHTGGPPDEDRGTGAGPARGDGTGPAETDAAAGAADDAPSPDGRGRAERATGVAARLRRGVADAGRRLRGPDAAARDRAPRVPRAEDGGGRAAGSGLASVAVGLLVVAGGIGVAGVGPAAALFGGDDRATSTVAVDEIRLGDDGRICAAEAGPDAYRVTVTDARLVGAAVYHQEGDDAVRAAFPAVDVAETLVMYTTGENEGIERLAATTGCTERDQTSRTVFRTHRQTGSTLRASEGVTMLNLRAVDGAVPDPGGYRHAAPAGAADDRDAGLGDDPAPGVADLEERVRNATGDPVEPVGGTVEDAAPEGGTLTGLVNDTDPANGTGVASAVEGAATDAADRAGGDEAVDLADGADDGVERVADDAAPVENGSAAGPDGSAGGEGATVGEADGVAG